MQSNPKQNKKKVLYIITKSNFGGAQKYVYELATSLDKNHHEVSVALGGNGTLKNKLESQNITVISIPHLERDISISKEFKVFFFLIKLFRKHRYDVVHLNSSKIGGLGTLAGRLARISKIVFTAHGWAFNENRSVLTKSIIKISYFITIFLSTKTIAVSYNIKEQVAHWPFVHKKIVVVHNAVKPINFVERNEAINAILSLAKTNQSEIKSAHEHKMLLVTLAELHPIKGLDILIEAFETVVKTHPYAHLIICGEGQERVKIETLLETKNLSENITLLGFVDNASQYLPAFDMFVLPSRSEALSLAILEAGLAKLPIVATRVGGIPEVISSSDLGILVQKEDSNALTHALNKIIENKKYRNTSAHLLHKHVSTNFTVEKMIRETTQLY